MRGVWLSLLATLIGLAMVGGGIWGLVSDVSDDDDDASASAEAGVPKTSSAAECSTVAKRDERFKFPHDLSFGPYGRATVKCNGSVVVLTMELSDLKPRTFYQVLLQKGRRKEEVGSFLAIDDRGIQTVTIGGDVKLSRYDFVTVQVDPFFTPSSGTESELPELPYTAPL